MPTQHVDLPIRRALILSTATAKVAERFELKMSDLGCILGISRASASRLMRGTFHLKEGGKSWEMALLLIRLYHGVASLVGNDDDLAIQWLRSPNSAFDNACPYDHIRSVTGLVFACDYVDAHRHPSFIAPLLDTHAMHEGESHESLRSGIRCIRNTSQM